MKKLSSSAPTSSARKYWNLRRIALSFILIYALSAFIVVVVYNTNRLSSEEEVEERLRLWHQTTSKSTSSVSTSSSSLPPSLPPSPLIVKTTTNNATRVGTTKSSPTDQNSNRQCRVIIEDKVDFHFEVIESVIKKYPLPLHKLQFDSCDHKNQPIHFQFSLFQNRVDKDKLNRTMYWSWYQYYSKYLRGKIVHRFDGSTAYIGEMINYEQYNDSKIDAIIGVTCDWKRGWYNFIELERNYCVLHGMIDKPNYIYKHHDGREERLCWLNPMFEGKCYFLPIDLPLRNVLDQDEMVNKIVPSLERGEIRLCVIGSKDFVALAEVLLLIGPEYLREHQVKVHVHTRRENSRRLYSKRTKGMLDDIVSFILDEPFLPFQRRISQCSMMLPMVDPETQPRYFPGDLQKLTGSISQLVAYKIPSVMRDELYEIYKEYMVGIPVTLHQKGTHSFASAIKAMIVEIKNSNTTISQSILNT